IRAQTVQQFLSELPPIYEEGFVPAKSQKKSDFVEEKNELFTITYDEKDLCYLPPHLWKKILVHLDMKSLCMLSAVSTNFYRLANENVIWRAVIRETFGDKNDVLIPKGVLAKQWYLTWRKN